MEGPYGVAGARVRRALLQMERKVAGGEDVVRVVAGDVPAYGAAVSRTRVKGAIDAALLRVQEGATALLDSFMAEHVETTEKMGGRAREIP